MDLLERIGKQLLSPRLWCRALVLSLVCCGWQCWGVGTVWAQLDGLFHEHDPHGMWRGPGGYFASYKILIVVLVFTIWVALVDYANREALRLDEYLKTKAPVWSPVYLVAMMLGLVILLALPWFWAGLPIMMVLAFTPPMVFLITRNQQVDPELRRSLTVSGRVAQPLQLVEVENTPVEFQPKVAGKNPAEIIFAARRLPTYFSFAAMCDDLLRRRGENLVISCSREKANVQMQIDGQWHLVAEMESAVGQNVIAVAQLLIGAAAEPSPRPLSGQFGLKRDKDKAVVRLTVTPSKTEYRAQLRIEAPTDKVVSLADLGMQDSQMQIARRCMSGDGFFVVAATPTQGATTLWKSCLSAADRWTRDWYAIVPNSDTETHMENIQRLGHPDGDVDRAIQLIAQANLKQAGAFVVPQLFDPKFVSELIRCSRDEHQKIFTRVSAKSAAEGLLRAYAAASDRKAMAEQLRGAIYQRLVRRLCTTCRERQKVPAEMIKKLNGDPRVQDFLYVPKTIPQELPKKYQPCPTCNDLGYVGRIGVFEVIEMNDTIRQVLLKQPKVEAVAEAARKTGSLSLMQSGYPLLLQGVTSVDELKRVCST
jgi:general secretion pathway protein E